jgi:hypothetical protein
MYSESGYIQVTFSYRDGHSESFNIYAPVEEDGTTQATPMEIRHLLKKDWWVLHLPEQSVFINLDNVIKMEVKPPMPQLRGEDVFANVERITALNRTR